MAYCQNCGAEMSANANFCSSCGAAVNGTASPNTGAGQSDTVKTVLTAAGTAAGVSLLGNACRRRHRRYMVPPMPPHGRLRGGPGMHRGPGPGGRGPGRR